MRNDVTIGRKKFGVVFFIFLRNDTFTFSHLAVVFPPSFPFSFLLFPPSTFSPITRLLAFFFLLFFPSSMGASMVGISKDSFEGLVSGAFPPITCEFSFARVFSTETCTFHHSSAIHHHDIVLPVPPLPLYFSFVRQGSPALLLFH